MNQSDVFPHIQGWHVTAIEMHQVFAQQVASTESYTSMGSLSGLVYHLISTVYLFSSTALGLRKGEEGQGLSILVVIHQHPVDHSRN